MSRIKSVVLLCKVANFAKSYNHNFSIAFAIAETISYPQFGAPPLSSLEALSR